MPSRSLGVAVPVFAAVAFAVGGCGGDDASVSSSTAPATTPVPPSATGTGPVASAPDAPPPPPDATAPLPPSTTEQPPGGGGATTTPSQNGGGAGAGNGNGGGAGGGNGNADNGASRTERNGPESERVRVPATYTIRGDRLTPHQITVPPFLAVQLTVQPDGKRHVVVLRTPKPRRLVVMPNAAASVTIPGQRGGTYPISLDGTDNGTLFVGGEVGP